MSDQASGLLSPWLRARRFAAARVHLVPHGRVLDLGCGVGDFAVHIPPNRYLGVDSDTDSLAQARSMYPSHLFVSREEFETTTGGQGFTTVLALAVIEHVAKPVEFVRSLVTHLEPTGRIIITTPHPSLRRAHELGAKLGLFSREAAEEHQELLDHDAMSCIADQIPMAVTVARRFLAGANQLFVLEQSSDVR